MSTRDISIEAESRLMVAWVQCWVAPGPHVDPSSPFEVVLLEFSDQGPVGSMTPK